MFLYSKMLVIIFCLLINLVWANTPNQTVEVGQSLNISWTFDHTIQDVFISQLDGSPLPTWLHLQVIPKLVGNLTVGDPTGLTTTVSMAYVIDEFSGSLSVVNLTNPNHPTVIGTLSIDYPTGVTEKGSMLVISQWGEKIKVVNVTRPNTPTVVGCCAGGDYPDDVTSDDNWVYIASSDQNLQIIDIQNSTSPVLISQYSTAMPPHRIIVKNSQVYIIGNDGINGYLQIIDVTNASNPVGVSITGISGTSRALALKSHYVYVATSGTGGCLQIFDVTNPSQPILTSTVTHPSTGLVLVGQMVVLVDGANLTVIDVLNPREPKVLYTTESGAIRAVTNGLYVETVGHGLFQIYDLSTWELHGQTDSSDLGHIDVKISSSQPDIVFSIDVVETAPPIINRLFTPPQGGVGLSFNYTFASDTFINIYNDPMDYTANGLPTWLTFVPLSRSLRGTPPTSGVHVIGITATNPLCGRSVTQNLTLIVLQTLTVINLNQEILYSSITSSITFAPIVITTPCPLINLHLVLQDPLVGHLSIGSVGGVASTYNLSTGHWWVSGNRDYVNVLLEDLRFTPHSNASTNTTVDAILTDQLGQVVYDVIPVVYQTTLISSSIQSPPSPHHPHRPLSRHLLRQSHQSYTYRYHLTPHLGWVCWVV